MSTQFRTFQNVEAYEAALARHGQWVLWTRAVVCPCISADTMQPDPHCKKCKGRGRLFRQPHVMRVNQEAAVHDGVGKISLRHAPLVGEAKVTHGSADLPIAHVGNAQVVLAKPFPERYSRLYVDYSFSTRVTVTGENSEVVAEDTLRVIEPRFTERGKDFTGAIASVELVHNADKDEDYEVEYVSRDFVKLWDMGNWEDGDTLEVDYTFVKPFNLIISGVSPRQRYEQPYIADDSEATLVTPYWVRPGALDLFTALAIEHYTTHVIRPTTFGPDPDEIRTVFDISRIDYVIDTEGKEYYPGVDFALVGRNMIRWFDDKPLDTYTIAFWYHPTFAVIPSHPTLRNAENKTFVNRTSLKLFDRTHEKVVF